MNYLPAQTRAIVVGIDVYKAGSTWNLNGPAADASKFARWLVDRGVPAEQVELFLSPLDRNELVIPPGVRERSAEQTSLEGAFTQGLERVTEPLLFLYWGSHGVTDAARDHKLFFADASTAHKRCLDLSRLLDFLKSDYFQVPGALRRLIVVVDACANLVELQNWKNALTPVSFPQGKPVPSREQFVLYAARPGEITANLNAEGTGLLSRELRPLLDAVPADTWPPDMMELTRKIRERFLALDAKQTPSYYWSSDWNGAVEKSNPRERITLSEDEITRALLGFPEMSQPSFRYSVVAELGFSVLDGVNAPHHARNIVKACRAQRGGIRKLLQALHGLGIDSENVHYHAIKAGIGPNDEL